jgi:hypothetical protein
MYSIFDVRHGLLAIVLLHKRALVVETLTP